MPLSPCEVSAERWHPTPGSTSVTFKWKQRELTDSKDRHLFQKMDRSACNDGHASHELEDITRRTET